MEKVIPHSFQVHKKERLKSASIISQLFEKGQSFSRYPLRLVWMEQKQANDSFPVQVAFSVSKRKFKLAVDRNRIKRQMREAWRLNKHLLYEKVDNGGVNYALMIIYVAKEKAPYAEVEKNMQKMIRKFIQLSVERKH